jgi:cell division septation protein DedD
MRAQILLLLLSVVLAGVGLAQTTGDEPNIQRRLELIEKGEGESVKAELPALMTTYQNNPGVIYLQAVLTSDGNEASKLYQNIVDNFPRNEWADDALFRLYQYYYSIGLYKTAEQKLAQLKAEYPFSAYASEEPLGAEQKPPVAQRPIAVEKPVEQPPTVAGQTLPIEEKPAVEEKPVQVKPRGGVQKFATGFTVQVGAFSTIQNAEELKKRFEREGYAANIFSMVSGGKKLHKVWVGEFKTFGEARQFGVEVKKKFNLESMVVSR